jgi:UDP-N-acetylmuramoyl-L-alanyl-D-glutamate--2,6-diaminopimelate ligase
MTTPEMSFASSLVRDALARAGVLVQVRGAMPDRLVDITDDSRQVAAGSLFVAVRGTARDGHDFLAAIADRAAAAIVEDPSRTALPSFVVTDARRAAPIAAAVAYGNPGSKLRLVGVTGTNGKTTTVGMLRHLLDGEQGGRSASIGTLGVLVGSEGVPQPGGAGLTTPGPIELQRVLRALVDADVTTVAMEVSSHSLDQRRVDGLEFAVAVFTNLTRDHLDYHGTMDAYVGAKARLVDYLTADGVAVVNADDDAWQVISRSVRQVRFSLAGRDADVCATDVRYTPRGSEWELQTGGERAAVQLPLVGDFNVANALGAAAAAWSTGMGVDVIARRLSTLPQVPGRLERVHERPTVLRDYAHTPDALERALMAVRPFATKRLIVAFGCGGDRDRGKRPQMGGIAERLADHVIVTSDNPRTEDPDRIIDDIEAGMKGTNHERITDRHDAIARALTLAATDDVIMLAGKGHETYQIRGTIAYPFDEREIVRELTTASPPIRY